MTKDTKFKIKGDASVWEVISFDSATGVINARNTTNGFEGKIAKANVIKILEVATSIIPPENIKIVDPEDVSHMPKYGASRKTRKKRT